MQPSLTCVLGEGLGDTDDTSANWNKRFIYCLHDHLGNLGCFRHIVLEGAARLISLQFRRIANILGKIYNFGKS